MHPDEPAAPRLLDRVRLAIRARHFSPRTEKAYVGWIRRFIVFHRMRHPREMGEPEILRFVEALAQDRRVSASTQNQALSAVMFLYREVMERRVEWDGVLVRAQRPVRLPVVLSRGEVATVLGRLEGPTRLVAELLYGSGLRLLEALALRVKDVDFACGELLVRDGKGRRDRVSVLPTSLCGKLEAHLVVVRRQHEHDLETGAGYVALPDGLRTKYPAAPREWGRQWVFPATRFYVDRVTGERRRHHLHESVVQRAFKVAVRASGLAKAASCHTLRHYAESRTMPSDRGRESDSRRKLCLKSRESVPDHSA